MVSFEAGTLIETQNGSIKIEDVKIGDRVAARDEFSGKTVYRPVTNLFRRTAPGVVHLSLDAPNGKREVLKVTSEHPFFVKGKGWTEVRKLALGDQIVSGKGGFLAIANMRSESQPTLVYNFEVAQNHNYFVGEEGALAHNAGYGNSLNSSKLTFLYELIKAATGDRMKCGISNNPDKRYPKWWLEKNGYKLKPLSWGNRRMMRELERGENMLNPGPLVKRP